MSKLLNLIGSNIRSRRKELGISQEKLAELCELHRTYIGGIERGERNVSVLNIEKIATALRILPHELLGAKDNEFSSSEECRESLSNISCVPLDVDRTKFNLNGNIPYGLTTEHIGNAMDEFVEFLSFFNTQLSIKSLPRLESFLMPANFSSIVGEFMNASIPKYCSTLVKNQYHNGHPDLVPANKFKDNSVQYAQDGIEIKGSRRSSGWQGHNPENVWLMVFHFDSNTAADENKGIKPKPFQFKGVYGAKLEKSDWNFSGRSASSRRTITASVNKIGCAKMKDNWLYKI